jgi:hypothetical protein
MPGGTKQAVSQSTQEPWKPQQEPIKYGLTEASDLYKSNKAAGPQYFPTSTVAGFSPEQTQAFGLGADRARAGNQTMNMSEGYNRDVLSGKYLNSDPFQDELFNNIKQKVMPAVNSQFMGSGRSGSSLQGDTLTRALTESYAPIASQNYQFGMGQMDAAANRAPMYAADDYTDIGALEAIGQQKQGLAQNELQDAVNRFNFNRDFAANNLGQYQGFIGGNYGGSSTSSTPYQKPSIWGQIGGGLLGLGGLFA